MSFSFPVRPQNIVVSPRLNEGVKEGTINLTCSVQQVKPQPKIYWQIGDEGPMHNGSDTDSVTKHPNGTFSIQSSYQWQAKHEDDSKSLYCIITLDGDHKEVLGKEKTRISVLCEYPLSNTSKLGGIRGHFTKIKSS